MQTYAKIEQMECETVRHRDTTIRNISLQLRFCSRGSVLWPARPKAQLAVCFPAQVAHQAFGLAMAGTLEKAQTPSKKHISPPCDIL